MKLVVEAFWGDEVQGCGRRPARAVEDETSWAAIFLKTLN